MTKLVSVRAGILNKDLSEIKAYVLRYDPTLGGQRLRKLVKDLKEVRQDT